MFPCPGFWCPLRISNLEDLAHLCAQTQWFCSCSLLSLHSSPPGLLLILPKIKVLICPEHATISCFGLWVPASLPAQMLSPITLARVPLLLLCVFSGIPPGLSDLQPITPPLQPSVPEHHLVHYFSPVEKKQWNRMLLVIPLPHCPWLCYVQGGSDLLASEAVPGGAVGYRKTKE